MKTYYNNLSIKATSWIRFENYIKVPNPFTQREVFLTNEKADIFVLIDYGYNQEEILSKLKPKYSNITMNEIIKIINLLLELDVIQEVDQFD
ncbi:MAG: hypothetical protein AB7W47_11290 [Calditrichaceae bacterium]